MLFSGMNISNALLFCAPLDHRTASTSYTTDLETGTNLCRQLSLCATEDNIDELLARRHRSDLPTGGQLFEIHSAPKFDPFYAYILPGSLHDGIKEQ